MSKEKKISTSSFEIENNIISFNDCLLQISNISHISVEPPPKKKFKLWTLFSLIVGIYMLQSIEQYLIVLGVILLIAELLYVFMFFMISTDNGTRYLHIYLNSGAIFYFYCEDDEFVKRVLEVLKYCMNDHSARNVKIDFKQCKLYNSPVITGSRNEVY